MIEVEVKVKLDNPTITQKRIRELGFKFFKKERQTDYYYSHPNRDFSQTDEALRVREVNGNFRLTYKGPKLDKVTKTREEIEISISDAKKMGTILNRLGFKEVGCVKKERITYRSEKFNIFLDDVEGLGKFIEIEKLEETYKPEELLEIVEELRVPIENIERRSYLELLLRL
jgi:adenylate cyclase class 2